MIDYQLLDALSYVIAEKGFERAAKKMFLTQSAVSKRIHQLEALLGQPVLVRTQPPSATALGKRLLNHLQQVRQLEVALNVQGIAGPDVQSGPLTVKLVANVDSLATWLPAALAITEEEAGCQFQFEIITEDQSIALQRMKAGEVMVCICSSAEAVNGGKVSSLGALRYKVIASPAFIRRYDITGPEQLSDAPCLVFNEHDRLQHDFLQEVTGTTPSLVHLCPSSEGFKQAMLAGIGYGLLPVLQLNKELENGELVDLMPGYHVDTPLYWHYWQTESPQLKTLREFALLESAKRLA